MNKLHKINPVVIVGIPTLQDHPINWEWTDYFYNLAFPLGCSVSRLRIKDKYVADARNEIAEHALKANAEWVLFISDDVIAPPRAFEMLWRHRQHLVTGVYWSKYQPTQPYLWKNGPSGEFLAGPHNDWTFGEYFEIDWAGCDCLLINTEVFRRIERPWFSHEWAYTKSILPANLATEDVYFYTKAREAGFKLYCDTAVQCDHIDRGTGIKYGLTQEMPHVIGRDKWKPKYDLDIAQPLIADIGCGYDTPYFVGNATITRIDSRPEVKPDIVCDVRSIPMSAESYDMVHVRHVLEHFSIMEHEALLKEWTRILKVGGLLIISVPNLAHAAREVLRAAEDSNYDATYAYWQLYGRHEHGNIEEIHKSGFTISGMRRFLSLLPMFDDVRVEEKDDGINVMAMATKARSSAPFAILPAWDRIANGEVGNTGNQIT